MIKSKALLRKCFHSFFSKNTDLDILEEHFSSFDPASYRCSHCKQIGQFSKATPYSRDLITIENGVRVTHTVMIPRYVCSCGHSHSVLPDILVPFASYSIRFILHVLKMYLCSTTTVASLCEFWQISVSTLYDWIHRFREHYNLWVGVMYAIKRISISALDHIESTPEFPSLFLQSIGAFSFLQRHTTHSNLPPDS